MHQEYWINKWQTGDTRFNESNPHRYLVKYFNKIVTRKNNNVFVPLCGKSIDMTWLLEHQQKVIGVELSDIPVNDFFSENKLEKHIESTKSFTVYKNPSCTIYTGNIFDLRPEHLKDVNAVYDRGAFIALPPETMRQQYINWLKHTLPAHCKILLITFEFNQNEMKGPPFSVTMDELKSTDSFSVKLLECQDIGNIKPHWKEKGLRTLKECVYLLEKL
jgi:thiopurine S-methyltransferase